MCAVLRDALEPNLLRTGEGTPVLVHTGPFGNIATGCSSVIADRVAAAGARDGGYILTEAGFGSDMGLERFINLKCAVSGMHPSVAVVVVTIRALKAHSGRHRLVSGKDLPEEMLQENVDDVRDGAANLLKHLQIVRGFGITPVVAVNVFPTDHDAEIEEATRIAGDAGARVAVCHPVTRGGEGCLDLAGAVVEACQEAGEPASSRLAYEPQDDLCTKISKLADIYGADGVDYTPAASRLLEAYEQAGFGHLPVIVAKTPLSLSQLNLAARACPPGGACRCARCAWPRGPATSTRSAAACRPCRGCRAGPPPSASTSTSTPGRSWGCVDDHGPGPAVYRTRGPWLVTSNRAVSSSCAWTS